jgi:aspartokinase
MVSITRQVWEILDNDITIKKDLERGIINVSALAQYILDTYKIEGSLDSVISSIRRYRSDTGVQDDFAKIAKSLREAILSTKTNITLLTLRNSSSSYKYIGQLLSQEDFHKNDVFRMIKTRHEVQVIVDRDSMEKVKNYFPEGLVEDTRSRLAEISIQLTKEGWETSGVLSRITNELATQGINIVAVFSVYPSITIFMEESTILKAHDALIRISGK